jgi:acyl-CoA thioester hydrolase
VPLSDFRFAYRFRVRWSEVDPQGVVFNARYLDYGDIGVTEYWRAVDFRGENGAGPMDFHVARAEVDFKRPIKSDEMIDIWARTERFGTSSMAVLIELHGAGQDDLRAVIREVHVFVDLATHKSKPIPEAVKAVFRDFDTRADMFLAGERALD